MDGPMPITELEAAGRLATAVVVGAVVGLEREWSGQTIGPAARFAGVRTFLLLGLSGGVAGVLSRAAAPAAAIIIAATMALTLAAYVIAALRPSSDIGGTTEAAALAVIALGVVAGCGWLFLAAGAGSVVVLALSEKTRLHWFVGRVSEAELHATLQFAVLALVVLPLLPEGPFGGALGLRPRAVWMIALMFSALSFVAYLLRRALGAHAGYIVSGLAGGLLSSTAVTLEFSRRSRAEPENAAALAFGVIGACTVLIPRVIVLSALLDTTVAMDLARLLWAPAGTGALITLFGWRSRKPNVDRGTADEVRNPLRLLAATQMALAFQAAISVIALVRAHWGTTGVYATASVLGFTDIDALTMSMSRLDSGLTAEIAATAIVIGMLVNTALKLGLSITLGAKPYRRIAAAGLAGLGAITALALAV
jgi:uncharacterized membrane protein (DUF4010 family)